MRALRALSILLVASSSFLLGCGGLPEDGALTESAIKGGDYACPIGRPRAARRAASAKPAAVKRAGGSDPSP